MTVHFFQRYTHDPNPIMRHFAGQARRRPWGRAWVIGLFLACITILGYLLIYNFTGLRFENERHLIVMAFCSIAVVFVAMLGPSALATRVHIMLEGLGSDSFLQDLKLSMLSHRRIFFLLFAGSWRRSAPILAGLLGALMFIWVQSYLRSEEISLLTPNRLSRDEFLVSCMVFVYGLCVGLARPVFDLLCALTWSWNYVLRKRRRWIAESVAVIPNFLEILLSIIGVVLIIYFLTESELEEDGLWIFPALNIGSAIWALLVMDRLPKPSKQLGISRRLGWTMLGVILLNIPPLLLMVEDNDYLFASTALCVICGPVWVIKLWLSAKQYSMLLEHWPMYAEARLGSSR